MRAVSRYLREECACDAGEAPFASRRSRAGAQCPIRSRIVIAGPDGRAIPWSHPSTVLDAAPLNIANRAPDSLRRFSPALSATFCGSAAYGFGSGLPEFLDSRVSASCFPAFLPVLMGVFWTGGAGVDAGSTGRPNGLAGR